MIKLSALKHQMLKDPKTKKAYEDMALEFVIARKLITERLKANMTQEKLAEEMGTTQPVIARLESGASLPSLRTLERYAHALGKMIELNFKRAT